MITDQHSRNVSMIESALALAAHGWRVFPLAPGSKEPIAGMAWKNVATTDRAEIEQLWSAYPDANIGVACGAGSDLFVLDFDSEDAPGAYEAKHGRLPVTLWVKTPHGYHAYFRHRRDLKNSVGTLLLHVDARGEGGYVVAPGSKVGGQRYEWFTAEDVELVDAPILAEPATTTARDVPAGGRADRQLRERPVSIGNRASTPLVFGCDILASAEVERVLDEVRNAPEGTRNGTLNSAALRCGRLIAAGRVDEATTIDALHEAGLVCGLADGEVRKTIDSGLAAGMCDPLDPPARRTPESLSDVESSWVPMDWRSFFDGDQPEREAELLVCSDGVGLLYPGGLHSFAGAPESGKTWAALLAVAQQLELGGNCLYLDYEGYARDIAHRLEALGVAEDEITKHLCYISHPGKLDLPNQQALRDLLANVTPTVVVIDGVTEAMQTEGLDPNSNPDAATFLNNAPKLCASSGAAFVMIDHVTKASDQRGKFAIGAQHKLAAADAAYIFETVEHFAPGHDGRVKITIAKDRHGQVRRHRPDNRVGDLTVRHQGSHLALSIEAPRLDDHGRTLPTTLMQRVSSAVEAAGADGLTRTQLIKNTTGRESNTRTALNHLIASGYVADDSRRLHHVRPYRPDDSRG